MSKKKPNIAMIHYSCPPVIGGVEFVIAAHAKLFADAGYNTKMIIGDGESVHPDVKMAIIPEISSKVGCVSKSSKAIEEGKVPKSFEDAVKTIEKKVLEELEDIDVCIIHNVLTMHFNLALTTALRNIIKSNKKIHFIGWTHDLTFTDPSYENYQHDEYPWNLLSKAVKNCDYCAISSQRQKELKKLFKQPASYFPVMPDGIDIRQLLGLSPFVTKLFLEEKLHRKDFVAVTPTRIVRRKNLEEGIKVVASLKRLGKTVRWMITGAPDHHNDDSMKYFDELVALTKQLNVEKEVMFLCEHFKTSASNEDIKGLYGISNMLLFPSEREGFGIPVLEAGIMGLLVVISDIPSLREIGGRDTVYIYQDEKEDAVACRIVRAFNNSPRLVFKKKIISNYSWDAIFADNILPAINKPSSIWKHKKK